MENAMDHPRPEGFESERLMSANWDDNASETDSIGCIVAMVVEPHDQYGSMTTGRLMILTIGAIGLQTIWSVVMSNGTPYFTYIGMSPTVIAAIWMAGPITGTLFQPYIGAISDASRHPWGRRKFYIIIGTVSTILSILLLRQSIEIGMWLAQAFGAEPRGEEAHTIAQAVAIVAMTLFSFTTCPLQAGLRAFIVENCPSHQQEEATAWVCRFVGIGSMTLYMLSYLSLPDVVPVLGDTQFKALCLFACLALGITVATTCVCIEEERTLIHPEMLSEKRNGFLHPFRQIYRSAWGLSSRIKRTMLVQSCAWYAWFTFLYYITSFVGELYSNPILSSGQTYSPLETDAIIARGTQVGSLAMLTFAAVALAGNIILPLVLYAPSSMSDAHEPIQKQLQNMMRLRKLPRLSLAQGWMLSQLLLGTCMLLMTVTTHFRVGIILGGVLGLSWATTQWVPLAIISAELSRQEEMDRESGCGDQGGGAGAVMGIYNSAISAPQVLAALGAGAMFGILQALGLTDQVRWVLGAAGLPAFVAAWLASGL